MEHDEPATIPQTPGKPSRLQWGGRIVGLGALCLSAIPVLYLAYYIYSFSAALPVNDQWDTASFIVSAKEGHLDLRQLFHFHNEHLIVIPRLLFAALALFFTWDNRAECWVTFSLVMAIFALLCRAVLRNRGRCELAGPLALVISATFLFSTTQWQNWLWGFQLAWPIPVLALTAAIPSLYRTRGSAITGIVILIATTVSVLSMGSGFMVPLILVVILSIRYLRRPDRCVLFWLALSGCLTALAIVLFLANKPPGAGTVHFGFSALQGMTIMFANPFFDFTRSMPQWLPLFFWAASVISIVLIALFVWFSVRGFWANAFEAPLFATGFALSAWGLLSVVTISLARGHSGFEGIVQSRYISYAVLLPVGLLLMAVALLRSKNLPQNGSKLCKASVFLVGALMILSLRHESSRLQWGRDLRGTYLALEEYLKVAPAFPIDVELRRICPREDRNALVDLVARSRLIRGMVPPGKHVPPSMVQVREMLGYIDTVVVTDSGSDLIGWCAFFDARRIPDAVFLGIPNLDGSAELLAPVLDRHGSRPDVVAKGGPPDSGWRLHLPSGYAGKTVTLYAYDWSTNQFYRSPDQKQL